MFIIPYFILFSKHRVARDINPTHTHDVNELKILLGKKFDMNDIGGVKKIFEMEIHRDMSAIKL